MVNPSDFKCLPYPQFRQKVIDLFGIDMDTCYYASLDPQDFDCFAICQEGYIMNSMEESSDAIMVAVNKLVFYDDAQAYEWLEENNPDMITYLVRSLGVYSNSKWLQFAIDHTNFNDDNDSAWEFLFSNDPNTGMQTFRPQMLDSLMVNAGYCQGFKDVLLRVKYEKEYPEDARLYSPSLDEIIARLEKVMSREEGALPSERTAPYTVVDPDGYANLREKPNQNARIIGRVNSGAKVYVLGEENGWKHVLLAEPDSPNNDKGYIHKSRIKSL